MKGGIRPVTRVCYEAMFNGIEMNIMHVRAEIVVVADHVLPETALPDASLALGDA